MRRFVWTATGKVVHVSAPDVDGTTECGRPAVGFADAADVLYWHVCKRCEKAVERWRAVYVDG